MQPTSPHPNTGKSLIEHFYDWEASQPDAIYLRQPVGDTYIDFSWREVGRQARSLAAYLRSLALPPQTPIGLIARNCAHWLIADLGIQISGHVSVPFYPTLTSSQLQQVLAHSGCAVLIAGRLDTWLSLRTGIPGGVQVITLPAYAGNAPASPASRELAWEAMLAQYPPSTDSPVPDPDDLFSIIYTSGTTGNPKGVMVTQAATMAAIEQTRGQMCHDLPVTRFFSYLPLCHIAERNVVECTSLVTGGTVYFAESLATFAQNLAMARPTHFLAVPRIWTKFQQGILAKMPERRLNTLLRIPIVSGLIKRKIREGLGLNDARLIITGAAPMPIALIRWFRRLGIQIQEAYGMTENLGAVSMMPANQIKDGTVGRINTGMEVRTDPVTGEILTRSAWNMAGYYREPALTAQTLQNGWLHTGDVGEVDADGYLRITGRVKDMYKSPKGEYIAPAQIEFGFADNSHIEQVCVTGQQLPQPIALLVLSETARQADRSEVAQSLVQTLTALNERMHTYERVHRLVVVNEPWTVENNLMTPTMKIKRASIDERYGPRYEPWYAHHDLIVWAD